MSIKQRMTAPAQKNILNDNMKMFREEREYRSDRLNNTGQLLE